MIKLIYIIAVGGCFLGAKVVRAESCLVLNGTLVQQGDVNEIAVHSRIAADGVAEYAFGETPLFYFRADGVSHPARGTLNEGMVRVTCVANEVFALEESLDGSSSSLRIRKSAEAGSFDVEGTGLYEVGTGRYSLRPF